MCTEYSDGLFILLHRENVRRLVKKKLFAFTGKTSLHDGASHDLKYDLLFTFSF